MASAGRGSAATTGGGRARWAAGVNAHSAKTASVAPPATREGEAAAAHPDVDPRPLQRVLDRLAQDLARHGRRVAFPEGHVAERVGDGLPSVQPK